MPDHDPASDLPVPSAGLGSRALRNTILVLAAKVVARLVALVTVLRMLNHLGPSQYGEFGTLVSYTAIVGVVLDLGFNVLFVREGARHPQEIQRFLRSVMSLRLLMSLVTFVLLAGALALAGLDSLLVPGFVLLVLASYANLLRNGLYAVQRLGYEALAVVLESLVLLALVLHGIQIGGDAAYFVWAYAAQNAFSCVYFGVVLAAKRIAVVGWRWEPELMRIWFWKGLPFALTFVLSTLYFRIDQPMVYSLRSSVEAGWYGAAYKPLEALLFVPQTFLAVVFPVLSVYHRERPAELLAAVNRFFKALLLMGWPVSVGAFLLAHSLDHALSLFAASEASFRILSLAMVLVFVNNAYIGALSASDHQSSFTWAAGWSLVANVALNVALIPSQGAIGASWATVATEVVLGAIGWVLVRRHVGRVTIFKQSWRVVLAGLVMGAAVYPLSNFGGWYVVIPILLGAVVYGVAILLLRAVTRDEITWARRALALAR